LGIKPKSVPHSGGY